MSNLPTPEEVRGLVVDFDRLLSEPPRRWDIEPTDVRDYRHLIYPDWAKIAQALTALLLRADEREREALRGALEPFVRHYEPWMDRWGDDIEVSTFARHTYGELRRAREALSTPVSVQGGEGQ